MDAVIPNQKSPYQLRQELQDAIDLVKSSITLYESEQTAYLKVIAGQLRIILCDTRRGSDNSLIRKIFPDPKLHPLSFAMPEEKQGTRILLAVSGTMCSSSDRITDLFDTAAPPIPLINWLDQQILDPTITIRLLIRSVADKLGGAHVDDTLNETLRKTFTTYLNGEMVHSNYLVEIARYVVTQLDTWMDDACT